MLERLRTQIGTAGLIVAIVALVAALGGGAYAATGGGKATASAKAKQGKQGKPGKTGPAGPAGAGGAQGPAGPAGAKGDAGANGSNGTSGTNGTNGKTVLHGTTAPSNATGTEGDFYIKTGTEPEIFGPKGASTWPTPGTKMKGENGQTGFTETLPSEKTETGTWLAHEEGEFFIASISFPIQLAAPLGIGHAEFMPKGATGGSHCTGGTAASPKANPGFVCVYATQGESEFGNATVTDPVTSALGAGVSGALISEEKANITPTAGSAFLPKYFGGTWAVTAP